MNGPIVYLVRYDNFYFKKKKSKKKKKKTCEKKPPTNNKIKNKNHLLEIQKNVSLRVPS